MDRKQRIQELRRKNKISQLIRKMKIIFNNLREEDFLTIDKANIIQKNVISIMNSMDEQEKSEKYPLDYNYKKWIEDNLKKLKIEFCKEFIVYLDLNCETFAVFLNVDDIFNNIDYIISMTSIENNGSSLIIINDKLNTGLCLWRTEYEIMGYKW